MEPTTDPYDYSTETLLRRKARECAELRELRRQARGNLFRDRLFWEELDDVRANDDLG